ncbi:MAG: hypothetical protein GY803_12345, partial [Chloroflexi bacterium]|nr:hypothetical protein [Chloroflexota bacterium]
MTNQETLLKATCKITKAKWSALLTCIDEGWRYEATHGLTKGRRAALQTFIQQPKTAVWLAGGLSSGRIRSRATGASLKTLQCVRIYAFPDSQHQTMLLAGADDLDKLARDTFRLVHHALSTVAASAQHLQARTE